MPAACAANRCWCAFHRTFQRHGPRRLRRSDHRLRGTGADRRVRHRAQRARPGARGLGARDVPRRGRHRTDRRRFGRRPALLASAVLFGATTLLGVTATGVESLAAWRFLTGLGLGAALPSAVALMAEFTPARRRSQLIVMLPARRARRRHPGFGIRGRTRAGVRLARDLHRRRCVAADRGRSAVVAAARISALPRGARGARAHGRQAQCVSRRVQPGLARDTWCWRLAFFANCSPRMRSSAGCRWC